ncbi:cyclic nucleotide-binding domain-containing protein, partial [bacterium]|nr:cyclic nucleotide-binding domain-containing protein [bacterium]
MANSAGDINENRTGTIADLIADNPLFESLSRPVILSIADRMTEQRFSHGKLVMEEGEIGDSFYIIYSGHVQAVLYREGKEQVLSSMGPGDAFGELALMSQQPRTCTIKTVGNVHLLALKRNDFEDLYHHYPELAMKFETLRRQRVSLLEDDTLNSSQLSKFISDRSSAKLLDYSLLDTLSKLNEAAGGQEQVDHSKETGQLAREMSKILCPMVGEELLFAGYLHEIGKVAIPREIVVKERQGEPLTPKEQAYFKG